MYGSSQLRTAITLTLLSGLVAGCSGGARSLPNARPSSALAPLAAPSRLPATARVPRRPSFVDAAPPAAPKTVSGSRAPLGAHPSFFQGETALSNGVYYLQLPNGNVFGYYSYVPAVGYLYHFDLGYEYAIDANDGNGGIYLYDFASQHWWYTSPSFPFPYLYDFTLSAFIYYYPDASKPQHYTTAPRFFYNFSTGQIVTIPSDAAKVFIRTDVQAALGVGTVLGSGGISAGGPSVAAPPCRP